MAGAQIKEAKKTTEPLNVFGLADLYGRKKAFMPGTLCQIAFASVVALHKTLTDDLTLAVLRAFQGVGDAATIPSAVNVFDAKLGILAYVFPPSRARSMPFATFAAGAPVGGAFDMIISGVLTRLSSSHWRSVFYLATFNWSFRSDFIRCSPELVKRVDLTGASLVTVGLVLIVFVLGQGEIASDGWKPPYIIALLIVGVIMLALSLLWEWKLERIIDEDLSKMASMWTPPPLLLGSGALSKLLVVNTGQNYDSHVYCRPFMQLILMVVAKLPLVIFIGTAFSLAISTIVFNTVVDKESAKLGVTINSRGTDAPIFAQLMGYEDAQGPPLRLPLSPGHGNAEMPTMPIQGGSVEL
ncbi:hypothetical protein DFJ58DRAFT_914355 [Suillus subalutaceus]|uniref:uncharacterized protein n=1 Tax=Suillus subalutaceus TaxID=48586 RepID=UPI001B87F227|nr:uncharacterized protein DFJ58DRAFT_914355 [Suillus subalutaceus]KAG1852808.1 hypothetical protein DFJ58DRAFT_914355 [Suillus subalutaceus]